MEGSERGCFGVKTGGTGVESMLVAGVGFGGSEGVSGGVLGSEMLKSGCYLLKSWEFVKR